jgi:beta-mannosidase
LLDGFHDLSFAYRFGPPSYDVAVAALTHADNTPFAQAAFFPAGHAVRETRDIGLNAVATPSNSGYTLRIRSRAFARWVSVHAEGYDCEDQYFHLFPGIERVLALTPTKVNAAKVLRGQVDALNASTPAQIELGT